MSNSTFSGNLGFEGGGIFGGGTVTVNNSTFSGNDTFTGGGAIANYGDSTVANSTLF